MNWSEDSPEYRKALEDYEKAFQLKPKSGWDSQNHKTTYRSISLLESRVEEERQRVLWDLGFVPIVHSDTRMESENLESEVWADESRGLVLELGIAPDVILGLHWVVAYFSDGTGFSIKPSDSPTLHMPSDSRRNYPGTGNLAEDIRAGVELLAKARDSEVLVVTDVRTAELREEFYNRYMRAGIDGPGQAFHFLMWFVRSAFFNSYQLAKTDRLAFWAFVLTAVFLGFLGVPSFFLYGHGALTTLGAFLFLFFLIVLSVQPFTRERLRKNAERNRKQMAMNDVRELPRGSEEKLSDWMGEPDEAAEPVAVSHSSQDLPSNGEVQ